MFDLHRRVALVTGAGQGVGAEIAATLAACGATVAVNDLFEDRAEAVAKEIGDRALAVQADVTDRAAVAAMVQRVEAEAGPVDVLVNNAGVPAAAPWDLKPFHETDPGDWDAWIRLNLHGVLLCTHAVVGGMRRRGWGRVVTITSEAGRTGEPLLAVYAAAKAGAAGFMRSLAIEAAADGVTANCVSLGTMGIPGGDPAVNERLAARYPAGRVGRPGDVAAAVVYLASDEAAWVTGQTLPVNGGYATS